MKLQFAHRIRPRSLSSTAFVCSLLFVSFTVFSEPSGDNPAARAAARETARLEKIRNELKKREADLQENLGNLEKVKSQYWTLHEKISEIAKQSVLDNTRTRNADKALPEISADLVHGQTLLKEVLARLRSDPKRDVKRIYASKAALELPEIQSLQKELEKEAVALHERETAYLIQYATELRKLTRERLKLIDLASVQYRSELLGYGPTAKSQALLEWQIVRRSFQ